MERGTVTIPLERYKALLSFEEAHKEVFSDNYKGSLSVVEALWKGDKRHFFLSNDEAVEEMVYSYKNEISSLNRRLMYEEKENKELKEAKSISDKLNSKAIRDSKKARIYSYIAIAVVVISLIAVFIFTFTCN